MWWYGPLVTDISISSSSAKIAEGKRRVLARSSRVISPDAVPLTTLDALGGFSVPNMTPTERTAPLFPQTPPVRTAPRRMSVETRLIGMVAEMAFICCIVFGTVGIVIGAWFIWRWRHGV